MGVYVVHQTDKCWLVVHLKIDGKMRLVVKSSVSVKGDIIGFLRPYYDDMGGPCEVDGVNGGPWCFCASSGGGQCCHSG